MKRLFAAFAAMCALLFSLSAPAADLDDPDLDPALRLTAMAIGSDIRADDPRVARTRDWLSRAMKATGETDGKAIGAACMRLSRYLFDVAKLKASPLEVLEAVAMRAPAGKPLQETTQRYFELRAKRKLDHAGAMAALAGS
ncbi:MAG: hypothetical protein AB1642_09970 [Pseudomonadota bacterium]